MSKVCDKKVRSSMSSQRTCTFRSSAPVLFILRNLFRNYSAYDIVHSNEASGMLAIHRLKVETFHHFVSEHRPSREIHYFTQSRRLRVRRRASSFSHLTGHRMAWECRTRESGHLLDGIDRSLFKEDSSFRKEARDRLGLNKFTILSVGRLVPHKNHELLVTAVSRLRDVTLPDCRSRTERNQNQQASEGIER